MRVALKSTDCLRPQSIFLAVFLLLLPHSPLVAQDVILIKSQDLPIYRDAQEGFQKIYAGPLQIFDLRGNPDEAETLLLPFKQQKQTLVVAVGLLAARMAQKHLPENPMVFSMLFDPDRFSLQGKQITGVTLHPNIPAIFAKMRTLFPEAKKIGVLFDPKKTAQIIDEGSRAAIRTGVTLIPLPIATEQALPDAARKLLSQVDLLWVVPDSTVITPSSLEFLLLLTFERKIPTVAFSKDLVKRGMVAAFYPDYKAVGEETARLTLLMLGGQREIPIRSAPRAHFSVNRTTAQKIGVTWNPILLREADVVYE